MRRFISFVILTICFNLNAISQCINTEDYTALRALYLATGGDDWDDNTGWPDSVTFTINITPSFATNMDTWDGVNCDGDRVNRVDLNENNLVGSLPSEIESLDSLAVLNLSDNMIVGNLNLVEPLENLVYINLSHTRFNGSLNSLTDLVFLEFIELADTKVTGDISNVGSLTDLLLLDLSGTYISGALSELSTLTSLVNLTICNTNIVGNLRSIRTLPLKVLKMSQTSIVGSIAYLNNMTDLIFLDLSNSAVVGELRSINGLINLRTLILENLNLSGCWPESFEGICDQLTLYSFEGNQDFISNQGWLDFCNDSAGLCPPCFDYISRVCLMRGGCSLATGIYQAVDTISYAGGFYISSGEDITLNGGGGISLSNGFEVNPGGLLHIETDGCIQY